MINLKKYYSITNGVNKMRSVLKREKLDKKTKTQYSRSRVIIYLQSGLEFTFDFTDKLAADSFANNLKSMILKREDYMERSKTYDALRAQHNDDSRNLTSSDCLLDTRNIVFLRHVQAITVEHRSRCIK